MDPMEAHGDANPDALLSRAKAGDEIAITDLLLVHDDRVRAAIDINPKWRAVLDTEDILQITYLEAVLGLRDFDGDASAFGSWLAAIARNNVRDGVRGLERDKRPHPDDRVKIPPGQDSVLWLWGHLTGGQGTPSSEANRSEFRGILETRIAQLPAPYAETIRLVHFGGRTLSQAAKEMDRTYGAVYLLHQRALDRMKSLMGPASDFLSR